MVLLIAAFLGGINEFDLGVDSLRRLHAQRHRERSEFLPHFERFLPAARAGVAAGELAFHVIAKDDEVVAVDLVFQFGDYATYFQGGRTTIQAPSHHRAG